jgi:hypothetical protein
MKFRARSTLPLALCRSVKQPWRSKQITDLHGNACNFCDIILCGVLLCFPLLCGVSCDIVDVEEFAACLTHPLAVHEMISEAASKQPPWRAGAFYCVALSPCFDMDTKEKPIGTMLAVCCCRSSSDLSIYSIALLTATFFPDVSFAVSGPHHILQSVDLEPGLKARCQLVAILRGAPSGAALMFVSSFSSLTNSCDRCLSLFPGPASFPLACNECHTPPSRALPPALALSSVCTIGPVCQTEKERTTSNIL